MAPLWFKEIIKKTSILLASPRFKELLVFLIFLMASTVFWLVLTMDETLENTIKVEVEIVNVPEDIEITSPCASKLKVLVRDRGTVFFNYWRNKPDPIRIPFSRFLEADFEGHATIAAAEIQRMIQNNLLSTTKVLNMTPDSLELYFCKKNTQKRVPVHVGGVVEVDSEYYLLGVQPTPKEIIVQAPKAILDTLRYVTTQPISLKGLTKNTTTQTRLQPITGAKFSQEEVEVEANVDVYIENTISVPILTSNFPADRTLRIFPSHEVKVTYTIGYAHNKEVSADSFVILLTYEQILQYQQQGFTKIPLQLRGIPAGVSNVYLEPKEVDYLIENIEEEE